MLEFTSCHIDLDAEFDPDSAGSDFIIGYARSLECLDEYLDKAFLDISCESVGAESGDNVIIEKLKKIVSTVLNFLKNLIKKFKEFITKYVSKKSAKTSVKEEQNDINKYDNKNSVKKPDLKSYHQTKQLGNLVYSWIKELNELAHESNIQDLNAYSNLEKKYKDLYAEWKKGKDIKTPFKNPDKVRRAFLDIGTRVWAASVDELGVEYNALRDICNFLIKLSNKAEKSTKDAGRALHHLKNLSKGDISKSYTIEDNGYYAAKEYRFNLKQPINVVLNLISKYGSKIPVSKLRDALMSAIKFVRSQIHCMFSFIKHSVEFFTLDAEPSQGLPDNPTVFKVYRFPKDVKIELSRYYGSMFNKKGGKLPVSTLIATTLNQYHGATLFDPGVVGGAIAGKGFKNDIGKGIAPRGTNVFVNAHVLIGVSAEESFAILVHECGHAYNSAAQTIKNGKREYINQHAASQKEYNANYNTDPDEGFANKAGHKDCYKQLPVTFSWFKKVIYEVKTIISRRLSD